MNSVRCRDDTKVTLLAIGDIHVGGTDPCICETAIRLCNDSPADFVLLLGDVVNRPTDENIDLFIDTFNNLNKPLHMTLGNHDFQLESSERSVDIEARVRESFSGPWDESFFTRSTPDVGVSSLRAGTT